uniref:Bm5595, isoform b n=1 Tax=Brugia malayi TaxID=6279 RepID=A0A1I9G362_BRUMA|nr:Bm5595, isoform b [Brugia malayi]
MSGTLIDVTASTSGAATPRSKIDALSRDDLIRFVKKQIDKLKTAKCENEKLKVELGKVLKDFNEFEEKLRDEQEKSTEKTREIRQLNEKCSDLEMKCSDLALQLGELKTQLEEDQDLDGKLKSHKVNSDSNGDDVISIHIVQVQNELTSMKSLLRKQTEECDKQTKEKEKLTYTVAELRSLLDDAYAQLESYKEKKSMENVITLEMADFEKTVERLQKELKTVNFEKHSLQSQLESMMKEMNNIHEEKALLTDNIAELNAVLKNLREEMEEKKTELALHKKERKDLVEELQKQVSAQNRERDQLISVIGVNEEKIGDLEALNASLNRQLASLCSQRESLQRQYDDLSEEHSTFRTRALYVLEQKKSEDDERAKGEIEILEETIRQQNRTIDNLTNSYRMLQNELDSSSGHIRTLSTEISNLQRQLTIVTESHKKEQVIHSLLSVLVIHYCKHFPKAVRHISRLSEQRREFELHFASEAKLNNELLTQIDASIISHNQEKENLLVIARQERKGLEEEMERLRRMLDEEVMRRKEMEKIQVATATQNVAIQLQKSSKYILPFSTYLIRPSIETADAVEKDIKCDDNDEKCEEKSLEEVIYGESEELIITDIRNQADTSVTSQSITQIITKQLEHTRELLNETEATNAKLVEQAKLLKEEIRRMERDRERQSHLTNTEYLKNVIMKFIAPEKVTDERGRLIPVLTTMLKLSNDEVNLLIQVAEADVATNKTAASSWRNYIWSGLS